MLLPLLLALAPAADAEERRIAVLISSNRGDAAETPLRYADDDAARLAGVLSTLGGVAPGDLLRLDEADAATVRSALGRLGVRLAAEREDRALLFVYYSGHADASDLHLGGTRLPLTELRALVSGVAADTRVLVLDACRAGELTRARGGVPAAPFQIAAEDHLTTEGLAIVTSAAAGEDAQESESLRGGVFTHHLVVGLRGAADSTPDGRVTLSEAYRYAYGRTVATTSRAPTLQHPSFALELRGHDDVVLTRLDDPGRGGWLKVGEEGEYLVFDARGQALVLEAALPAEGRVSLAEGRYLVRRRSPARLHEALVSVSAGQTSTLGPSALTAVPLGQAARRGGEARGALSLSAGAGARGPLADGLGLGPELRAGARVDLAPISLAARVLASQNAGENEELSLRHNTIGGEFGALKLLDAGRFSLGAGLSLGGALVLQRFETEGLAPSRQSGVGWFGSLLRAEWSPGARLSVGLELGLDATLLRLDDPGDEGGFTTRAAVVPHGGVDVGLWVF